MGKGKGKKGKREEKLAVRAAKKAAKAEQRALLPAGARPVKKPKVPKAKKPNHNPPGPASFPIPTGKPKPFTKSPQGAKWPALFKKHLGVLEAHIRALDRVRQSMKGEMGNMEEDERRMWELGEKGNWRVICEMMDRARSTLTSAREAAKGILPARLLKDKKGLGVTGTNFEPLGPQLAQRAAELNAESSGNDKQPTDSEGDSEMSDSSSSFSDDEDITAGDFMPLNLSAYIARGEDKSQIPAMEPNPYFVIDTNPTPVVVNGIGSTLKKTKKRANDEDDKPTPKKSKKVKKEAAVVPEAKPESEEEEKEKVNFEAVEAQLQAEVEAGLKAKAAEAEKAEETKAKKEKKKRRRSEVSEDSERVAEKKVKKEKSEKKEKKEKKRKVEDGADAKAVADDGGIKKKRKHKVDADA